MGTGSNWTNDETPQDIGFLTEPGEYRFHLDCGFVNSTDKETSTEVNVKVAGLLPTMMRLDTAVNSIFQAEAVDYLSYANPANSYTAPKVIAPATPQTDVGVGPSDPVRIAWLTDNVIPGSCQVTEVGPNAVTATPTLGEAGEIFVTLSSASSRVFQLRCMDVNGQPHTLEAKIHQGDICDVNGDSAVTIADITAMFNARNTAASSGDLRDANQSGFINVVDARYCATKCKNQYCAADQN